MCLAARVHVPKVKRQKFDRKSKSHILVGYCNTSKAYRMYDPITMKITVSRDVVFFEDQCEGQQLFEKLPNFEEFVFIMEEKNDCDDCD